jgi:assimilatory nitrate reductase electron transfer subunit
VTHIVVIGNGMAGSRFAAELSERDRGRRFTVTVVGEESDDAYNRALLPNVIAGRATEHNLVLARSDWYTERGIALLSGVSATRIDRAARRVRLSDGTSVAYDRLVLATGSVPVLPEVAGLPLCGSLPEGVVAFRTLNDCRQIEVAARRSGRAVVLGAGVLGVEVARALRGRGASVTLLQRGERLMERQLDPDGSRFLGRAAAGFGIDVRTGTGLAAVCGNPIDAVVLSDGSRLAAELLVLSCGVRPRTDLARACGLTVDRGVVVDDALTTSDPDIMAIGECAEHRGQTYGLVAPAWEQARVAAERLARPDVAATYQGSRPITRLKAEGIELAAIGSVAATADPWLAADAYGPEIVCVADHSRGVYQKLVIENGLLRGAILIGDARAAGTLSQLYDRGAAVPSDRLGLLSPGRSASREQAPSPTTLPDRTTICQCNGVTKGDITAAWQDGARTLREVAGRTRCTTGCGTCHDAVAGIVSWLEAADTEARPAKTTASEAIHSQEVPA